MAAEILAADTGLDLYKVDLASVVSKYIGETEKNLARVFDAAETTDAVLLFDEADALFGKRTDVRDSHDRYANIEVDYLLQRIEEYEGTVILTTNLERNIDEAFRRRIHVSVDFPTPDREARAAIWERTFPAATPVDELDVEFLSSLEFTGGNIKNVALTAAFLAADEGRDDGGRVTMRHVVRAAAREFRKTGRLVDPETFGPYRELVE
jgi:SpoVK/Ycf46/Vps4 family AAA+-type ATPase